MDAVFLEDMTDAELVAFATALRALSPGVYAGAQVLLSMEAGVDQEMGRRESDDPTLEFCF